MWFLFSFLYHKKSMISFFFSASDLYPGCVDRMVVPLVGLSSLMFLEFGRYRFVGISSIGKSQCDFKKWMLSCGGLWATTILPDYWHVLHSKVYWIILFNVRVVISRISKSPLYELYLPLSCRLLFLEFFLLYH